MQQHLLKMKIGIQEVRLLHSAVSYYLSNWPEDDPFSKNPEEKAHLIKMKSMFDAMLLEYNFHTMDDKDNEPISQGN